jgi:hypothetical protein
VPRVNEDQQPPAGGEEPPPGWPAAPPPPPLAGQQPGPTQPGWGPQAGQGQQGWGPPPGPEQQGPAQPGWGQQGWGPPPGQPPPGWGQPGWGPPPGGYPPGTPGYGAPGYGPPGWNPPRTEGTAIAALICAIGAWVMCPLVLAVVALVLASKAKTAIDGSQGTLTGEGLVTAARIIAWLNIGLVAVGLVFMFLAMAVAVGSSSDLEPVRVEGFDMLPTLARLAGSRFGA